MASMKPSQLQRVTLQVNNLRIAMEQVGRVAAELQEQLRELLSYCKTKGEDCQNEPGWSGYADVALKLAALLDGEGEQPPPPGPRYYWECNTCTFLAGSPSGADVHETAHPGHEMMLIQESE